MRSAWLILLFLTTVAHGASWDVAGSAAATETFTWRGTDSAGNQAIITLTVTPIATSPDGTKVPPAAQITDAAGSVWTLRSSDNAVLLNGQQAGGGLGTELAWCGGTIYVLGTTGSWWQWVGPPTNWVSFATTPC